MLASAVERRTSTGIGLIGLVVFAVLAATEKLDATWALVVVIVLGVLAALDELAARRPLIALAWVAAFAAGIAAYEYGGRWWGIGAATVAVLVVTPLANREVV